MQTRGHHRHRQRRNPLERLLRRLCIDRRGMMHQRNSRFAKLLVPLPVARDFMKS